MRLFKFSLAICLVIIVTLSTVFYSRSYVVTSIVNNYLIQHNSRLTCLDFTITPNFDLVLTHLCIDASYAEIELIDSLIELRFEATKIDINNLSQAISAISIDTVTVRAKSDIKFPQNPTSNAIKLSELPTFIRTQFDDMALLPTFIDIDVKTFSYLPFSEKKEIKKPSYQGHVSVNAQQLNFSLANDNKEDIFSFTLVKGNQELRANIATDLAELRSLLTNHKTALPVSLSTFLLDETWYVTGNVNSQLTWQNKTLKMKNKVTDFSFKTSKHLALVESVRLSTAFSWQTHLTGENLYFDFTQKSQQGSNEEGKQSNNMQLAFNSAKLLESLTAQGIDQQIINLIVDNAIDTLTIQPIGSLNVDFSNEIIISDGVNIISSNLNEPMKLVLNDLVFNYRDDETISVNLQKARFSLVGQANITQLAPYSSYPVKVNVVGEIEQHSELWQLKLSQGTVIELSELSLPVIKTIGIKKNKINPANIKSLISRWQGYVSIAKNDKQQDKKTNEGVTFALDINSQISQLNYLDIVQVNAFELNTEIRGSVTNIAINAKVIADNVPIAIAKFKGDLRHPSVIVSAQDVLLTDLLALKIKLPIELKLIDGTIDYRLTAQLKNSDDIMANPMLLVLSVKDVTGGVDGTWLQGLNWQQHFTLQNGQVKSIADNTALSNNLTIAKVETATPIHNLSTTTIIDFSQGAIKLLAHNIRGNLLGGRFDIEKAQWPFNNALPINVKLTKIDLEKLLELDKKQGIVVTGNVSGELPIFYDGKHFLIKEGGLQNVGSGIIQVYNNPAVEELKSSSTELKLAFDALENLHYHHLSSEVSMADDGYMLLVTVIKGRNPDLDNEVNLNLNLSYDLLGLLESLNITEHFESKVLKSLQK